MADKDIHKELSKPLPDEAIKPHPTKTYLSTIKAIYVTERFTEVFGVGGWKTKVEHITTQELEAGNPMVVVKVTFEVPEHNIYYECYGGNDNKDLGDAYKGATTDALTKIGSYLGVGIDVFKGKHTGAGIEEPKVSGISQGVAIIKAKEAIKACDDMEAIEKVQEQIAASKNLPSARTKVGKELRSEFNELIKKVIDDKGIVPFEN